MHDQVQRLQAQLASAHTDLHSASKSVSAVQIAASVDPAIVQKAIRNQTTAQNAVDSLNAQVSGPAAQLEALTKLAASAESLRHAVEDTAKAKIHTAAGAGIPPGSMWHKLGHLAGDLWHGLVIVAEVVSCVGGLVLGSHLVAPFHKNLAHQPDITKIGQFSIFLPRKPVRRACARDRRRCGRDPLRRSIRRGCENSGRVRRSDGSPD